MKGERKREIAAAEQCMPRYDWRGLVRGMRMAFTIPGLVMAMSFLGFGALVRAMIFPLKGAVAMDVFMWALPGQVVYVDTLARGLTLLLALLAVTLTAVRLMPMVVLVLAQARLPGARRWPEYLAAHFIAATLWVMSEMYMDAVPRPQRVPWVIGLGLALMGGMVLSTVAGYYLTAQMPVPLAAMLVFFTPAFFILALFDGARSGADWAAIALGALIGPPVHLLWPEVDLLLAGVIGGTLAMLISRKAARTGRRRP
ncbi:AzlC family ABC transporter permease [Thermopetrobacter sp. TC1]|uniref:AzlC family ABC transporter permease n=1 Tax=Thermopetrobacter sp. TC1 TaxID=1495045 RepID=UPI0018CE63FE|nr:AzlC family ABC transporter permease [Thermopetrobacter sp. TC1]